MTMLHLILAVAAAVQNPPVLTLAEAQNLAEKNGFAVRTAGVAAAKAGDLLGQTRSSQGLNVSLSGTYAKIENRDFQGAFGPPPTQSRDIRLQVTQVVDISGALRLAIQATRINKEAADLEVDTQKLNLRAMVREAYYQAIQAEDWQKSMEAEVAASKQRLEKANVRFRNDAIPRFDVIRFEADLRRSEQNLVDARQNAVLSKQQMNNILGRDIDTPFALEPKEGLPESPTDASALTQMALKSRPDLLRAEKAVAGFTKVRDREKKGQAPFLTLSASHVENFDASFGQAKGQTVGAATISIPLYDSNLTRERVKAANKDIQQAEILLEQARLGVALEVRAALTRIGSAKAAWDVAAKGEELAREALRLAQLRYDEGVGILIDVTTAQAELTRAQFAVIGAKYQFWSAYSALQRAVGKEDLGQ